MSSFQTNHKVNHNADKMFMLVADVEKYPQFVPYCRNLNVTGRQQQDDGTSLIIADMTIAYKLINETFTSKVKLNPKEQIITTESIEGPFRHMINQWKFEPISDSACEVSFSIKYEFKSRMLNLLMSALFEKIFRKYTSAFESRADHIYNSNK